MLEHILEFIFMMFLSVGTSFFILFIDFTFNENNIFDWYYLFIYKKFEKTYPKLFKILGGCVICYGTWVSFGLFNIYHHMFNINYIYVIPFIGINYIILKILKDDD